MAYCEKCGTKGLDPRVITVDKTTNLLIGPCCREFKISEDVPAQELEYGVELSSHYGILAYVRYAGLRIEFRRTPEEISKWFQNTEQMDQPTQVMEEPSSQTSQKTETKNLMN